MEQSLGLGHNGPPAEVPSDDDYWDGYVNEQVGAKFLGFTVPFLQNLRHRGGGPSYSKIGRNVRYTRRRLKTYADKRVVTSTSDQEQVVA